jgi:hypothetical protein
MGFRPVADLVPAGGGENNFYVFTIDFGFITIYNCKIKVKE